MIFQRRTVLLFFIVRAEFPLSDILKVLVYVVLTAVQMKPHMEPPHS